MNSILRKFLRSSLLIGLIFCLEAGFAQIPQRPNLKDAKGLRTGDWVVLYDSAFQNEVMSMDSAVNYLLVRYKEEKPVGIVEGYLMNGIKVFSGRLFSLEPTIRHGQITNYHPNGNVWEEAIYKYDSLDGPIKTYYENGMLMAYGNMKNNQLDGYWEFFSETGNLMHKGKYVNGKEEGVWELYHENGAFKAKGNYAGGKEIGYWEYFFDNGKPMSKGNSIKGNRTGRWLYYYENGNLKEDSEFSADERNGSYKWYFESGGLEQEGQMVNGVENSVFKYYYDNGQLEQIGSKINGLFEGVWKNYYSDGTLQSTGPYKNGNKNGTWTYYREDGSLDQVGNIVDDLWQGLAKFYYSADKLKSEGMFLNDLKEGEWIYYYPSGRLEQRTNFRQDIRHGKIENYDEDGTLSLSGNYFEDQQDGDWEYHYLDGTITIGTYKIGLQHGHFKRYHATGHLSEEGEMVEDKKEGLWLFYNEDGSRQSEGEYADNLRTGYWKYYNPDQTIKSEGKYKDGLKEGNWKYYNEDGQLNATGDYKEDNSVGHWKYYYANGQLSKEGEEFADKNIGPWSFYNEDGSLSSTGNWRNGKYHGTWTYFDEAGNVRKVEEYHLDKALNFSTYYDSVYTLIDYKRYDQAWEILALAKKAFKKQWGSGIKYAEVYEAAGSIYRKENKPKKALKEFDKALNHILKYKQDTSSWYYNTLPFKGYTYTDMGNHAAATAVFQRVIELMKQWPNAAQISGYTGYFNTLTNSINFEGKPLEAMQLLLAEKDYLAENGGTKKEIGSIYVSLVRYAGDMDSTQLKLNYAHAGRKYLEANDLKLHWNYPLINYELGRALNIINEFDSSLYYYQQALSYYRLSQDTVHSTYISTLHKLGDYYFSRSDYGKSRPYYQLALQRSEQYQMQGHWIYRFSLQTLAKQYVSEGYESEALPLYRQYISLEEKSPDASHENLSNAYIGMSLCLREMGIKNYPEAEEYLKKAMEVVGGKDSPTYQGNYWIAGIFYAKFLRFPLERNDESLALLKSLLKYAEKHESQNTSYYGETYQRIGEFFYTTSQPDSAIFYLKKAIEIADDYPAINLQIIQECYAKLAEVYDDLDDPKTGQSFNFQALAIIEQTIGKKNVFYASRLRDAGRNFGSQGNYSTAIKYLNDAIVIFNEIYPPDNLYTLNAELYLGENLRDNEQYSQSIDILTKTLEAFEKTGQTSNSGYLRGLNELAKSYEKGGQWDKADALFKQLPKISKQQSGENSSQYTRYIRQVGLFLSRSNKYDEAYAYLKSAFDRMEAKKGKSIEYAWYAEDLSKVQKNREEYVDALNLQEEAAEIYLRLTGESNDYLNALYVVAEIQRALGRFQESVDGFQKVNEIIEKIYGQFSYPTTQALTEMANTYWRWNKPIEGLKKLERVEELYDSLGISRFSYAGLYNLMGLFHHQLNDNKTSRYYADLSIHIADSVWGPTSETSMLYRNNSAFTYMYDNDFEQAEKLWLQAGTLLNAKTQGDITRVRWLDNLAALYLAWGKLDKAEPYWNEVTSILLKRITGDFAYLSESGKAAFWDAYKEDFEYYNSFAVAAAKAGNTSVIGQMFDNQLQTKSILLSTSTKERRRILSSGDSTLVNTYFDYARVKEQLSKYYGYSREQLVAEKVDMPKLEQQAIRFEKVLSLDAEGLSVEEKAKAINWKNIQKSLLPGEAAVELIRFRHFNKTITDSAIYVALILTPETKNAPKYVLLPNGNQLEDRFLKAYKSSIQYKLKDDRSYAQYWQLIDQELTGVKKVYLSADGVFSQINLATLLKPDGTYIRDAYEMQLLTSSRDILSLNRGTKTSRDGTAYLFGFPKYDLAHADIETILDERSIARNRELERGTDLTRFGFSELPGTKNETEEITRILNDKAWSTKLFLSDKALEEDLKAVSNPTVLHIATHGFFLDDVKESDGSLELGVRAEVSRENPLLRSGLLLTGAAQTARGENNPGIENGIFTAYEAMNLNLQKTELVVLSACETGRGEVKNGEGVYGLQRAFQIAGADAIIMSLWKVDDAATQLLMTEFYKNWTAGKSKSEALKLAQNAVKSQFDHPYYWGAFVLIGG